MALDSFEILGVNVSVTNLHKACEAMAKWIDEKAKTYVCVAPVATIIDCQKDLKYRSVVNQANMTTPDGMPLVWLGKRRGGKSVERTYGPDLLPAFCRLSEAKGYRHFFYGATEDTLEKLTNRLKSDYPQLNICGSYAPPMKAIGEKEDDQIIQQINDSKADVLWVGLGSPKQDFWMSDHRPLLDVPVIVGVGAAFDFLAGVKRQAPRWMQRSGLEWFFRLCQEPKRLWKRYIFGNTLFIWLLFKDKFKRAFAKA